MFRYRLNLLPIVILLACPFVVLGETPSPEVAKILADQIGTYRANGPVSEVLLDQKAPLELATAVGAKRTYSAPNTPIVVFLYQAGSDAEAYSLFTVLAPNHLLTLGEVGTASVITDQAIYFVKGRHVGFVTGANNKISGDPFTLAKELAVKVDGGDNDIPVLVRHLPNWETARNGARYITSFRNLRSLFPNQAVLDVVSFEAGAEAVLSFERDVRALTGGAEQSPRRTRKRRSDA